MAFMFPWSNFHELNLDWILSVVKEAKEIFVRGEGDIQHAVETADQALETAEQAAAGVIADGAVTIPKVNDEVFNLMAYIVSGSVNTVAIPAGSLVILRKSTVLGASDGIYVAAADIPASSVLTASDLLQPSPLPDAGGLNYVLSQITDTETAINAIERGLVIVVDGNDASSPVPVGALAYLKNNANGLQEGIYANISNAPYPTTGGTADANTFSAVPNVINSIREITGDGVLSGFAATDLTGAANELKTSVNTLENTMHQSFQNMAYYEQTSTATRTYTAGEYLFLSDNKLYVANTAIPLGTAFSVGGNISLVVRRGLNDLHDQISNLLRVEKITYSYTIPGGGNLSFNLYELANLSGYTQIGVVGYKTNSPGVVPINVSLENSAVGCFFHSFNSSSTSNNFEAYILYKKNL